MPDLAHRQPEIPAPARQGYIIEPLPDSNTDTLHVVVPGLSEDLKFDVERWDARPNALPEPRDPCIVVVDDKNEAWVPAWWPLEDGEDSLANPEDHEWHVSWLEGSEPDPPHESEEAQRRFVLDLSTGTVWRWNPGFGWSEEPLGGSGPAFTTDELGTEWGSHRYGQTSAATGAANRLCLRFVQILAPTTVTGIRYFVGSTASGNVRSAIFSADGNTRHAVRTSNSDQPGTTTFHEVAFDSPVVLQPGLYIMALRFSSATATYHADEPLGRVSNAAGAEAIGETVTPPSSTTSAAFPSMTTY